VVICSQPGMLSPAPGAAAQRAGYARGRVLDVGRPGAAAPGVGGERGVDAIAAVGAELLREHGRVLRSQRSALSHARGT
jgi:hypothetical protein